ncbi:MAG: hypothetical protein ACOC0A_04370, partial [Planctomycetota bacterium]
MSSDRVSSTCGDSACKDRLFHKPGLIYFWIVNDECEPEVMNRMGKAFVDASASAVVLHARAGLRVPYGGTDWFDMIEQTVEDCADRDLRVWLYDEDPFPSGAAGGRVFIERPEFEAREIQCYTYGQQEQVLNVDGGEEFAEYEHEPMEGLFCFPAGTLLWCGLVNQETGETVDLTGKVGTVRRQWKILREWDSRYYYPDTPLYEHPRAMTQKPEYALRVPDVPPEMDLLACVARPTGRGSVYGGLPDTLNPEATEYFLKLTHERYLECVGDHFGDEIRAIFTDEPKMPSTYPYTRGMFENFEKKYGYDLKPRLCDLFCAEDRLTERARLTRLHYREWCGEQFEKAWLSPVGDWCEEHDIRLVGHISPEDDPVEQSKNLGSLFPLFKHFALPGIDLIIPAVGDHRHPLINVGILSATGAAAQLDKPGVLSESLACGGVDPDMEKARTILVWQTMMGMTTPVVHAALNSTEGLREIEAPPDYGPRSPHWETMQEIQDEIKPIQDVVRRGIQVAPVAVVWPI